MITGSGNLEGTNPLPIDNYIWVLAALGLLFVFFKYRALAQKKRFKTNRKNLYFCAFHNPALLVGGVFKIKENLFNSLCK